VGGLREGVGEEGRNDSTFYAHMNLKKKEKKRMAFWKGRVQCQ
jgi:hypothetical protein